MKWLKAVVFVLLFCFFLYLRISPIVNQSVPYTYDQGRDFLKAEEIGRYHNLTFIGPTTGIMGVYHGAWWYYLLTVPYLLFNGWPTGFYIFMLVLSIVGNLLFFLFLNKEFNFKTALLFLAVVSISPYFVPLAFFPSNNIIAPYAVLMLIASVYYLFKLKKPVWLLPVTLSLGFIFEFEVSFGLFIIPVVLILLLVFPDTRKILLTLRGAVFAAAGLLIPLLPRILFEIKHQFMQTKTLLGFFLQPKLHNPKPYLAVLSDRTDLFWNYFKGLFYGYSPIIATVILMLTVFFLIEFRNRKVHFHTALFVIVSIVLLFISSLAYKDNFWSNYYEGIQYFFLFVVLAGFYLFSLKKTNFLYSYLIVAVFFILAAIAFRQDILSAGKNTMVGFKPIDVTVKHVYKQAAGRDFCLRIYTPPVVPYTYDYLLSFYGRVGGLKQPQKDFVGNRCFYIVESDSYGFRVDSWRKQNIPEGAKKIYSRLINDISVELWQK